jgi:hypothetical protein
MKTSTPIVTPNLAKKIIELRLVGTNLDALEEGINPFSVVLVDNASSAGSMVYQAAIKAARNYDELTKGVSMPLAELNTIQTTKVILPKTFATAKSTLKGFFVITSTLLGEQHPLNIKLKLLLDDLDEREGFFAERLEKHDPQFGHARLLRFVQLHTRAWFAKVLEATDLAEAQAAKLPPFHKPGAKLSVDDMTWLPDLPKAESTTLGPPESRSVDNKRGRFDETTPSLQTAHRANEAKRPRITVLNPQKNKMFDDFHTKMANTKFKDAIGKVGPPPTVQRDGTEVQMCASYHLRGQCMAACARIKDHTPHSPEEDQLLYTWCTKAFP